MKKFTINNNDREQWVNNDEGLYNWWKSERIPMRKFITNHRTELDLIIRKACGQEVEYE